MFYLMTLNTFYLWLYGIKHMVKNHSDRLRGNLLPHHGLPFPISSKGFVYVHHPTDRIPHTTAFVTPSVEHCSSSSSSTSSCCCCIISSSTIMFYQEFLFFIFYFFLIYRKLREDVPSKILVNLCVALFAVNFIFVFGMKDYTFNDKLACKVLQSTQNV